MTGLALSDVAVPDAAVTAPAATAPQDRTRGVGERWRSVPRRWQVVVVLLAALAGVDVAWSVVGSLGSNGTPSSAGPSSSFDPSSTGVQALAELLVRFGHPVARLSFPVSSSALAPRSTLVVADPLAWGSAQDGPLHAFLRGGGRAVLAGAGFSAADLRTILGTAEVPVYSPVGQASARAVGNAPEIAGVGVVDVDPAEGAWAEPGATTPLLQGPDGWVAVAADVGAGRVVLLATASPLRNDLLGRADNAAFALDAVGAPGRHVVFDENVHGFGGGGIGALPSRWKWALSLAGVAVLVWLWSAARRLGPAQPDERRLAPARVGYVEGLATVLAATSGPAVGEAVVPLRRATRAALCRFLGIPDATGDDVVRATARARGVPEEVLGPALAVPSDGGGALAVARAHAWLTQRQQRRSAP